MRTRGGRSGIQARQVGPGGSVVAIDQAPQREALVRERMQEAGIGAVEVVEGDAEAVLLPLMIILGIATAEEVQVTTLEQRLRADAAGQHTVSMALGLTNTWTYVA